MRLGIFLALVASAAALRCNSGNLILEDGIITAKSLESKLCLGTCTRTVIEATQSTVVFLGCQENEISNFLNEKEGKVGCSATELGTECVCKDGDFCSDYHAEENIEHTELANTGESDAVGPKCYVGYYAVPVNGQAAQILNAGDTVYCSPNMACSSLNSTVYGYDVEAYFCIPTTVCNTLIGQNDGCGSVKNENNTVYGCCCTDLVNGCLKLVNKNINPPTTVTNDTQTVNCYSGAALDYHNLGGSGTLCRGSCSYFSIRTTLGQGPGQTNHVLDIYTCDPVELCTAIGLKNSCGNLAISGTDSLLRGCCCDSDNCIDPTTTPPKYPVKQLKCFTGFYAPGNGYSIGAEQYCDGQCGRMEFMVNGTSIKYMMCAPYTTCQGLGIAQADQCYNPPLEEETKLCCCSSFDNCNIAKLDRPYIPVNTTIVPTNNYPILCYGGVFLNGNPVSNGAYSLCSGECATASFVTNIWGQQHNTTIYTCDPVSMCKTAQITNSCGTVDGISGVTACCCDQDLCYDPNRKPMGQLTCYTGIYVPDDNYLTGGEMQCDGWCASLTAVINNKTTNTYWCAPVQTCRRYALGMGGDNNCGSVSGSDNTLTGCCCSEKDNCNIPSSLLPNVTSIPTRIDPPIVCYEGLYINGQPSTPGRYRVCDGECASIFMGTTTKNNTLFTAALYTCEPSGSCSSMNLRNNCSMIDSQVNACCCDTDACIDPTVNRVPGQKLTCFAGLISSYNNTNVGAEVPCDGYCANITSTAGGYPFTSYHCMPKAVCRGFGLSNKCDTLLLTRAFSGCCCDYSDNCNVPPSVNTTGPVAPKLAPIACFSGLKVNGNFTEGSGFQTCQGDCMSLNILTSYANQSIAASIYSCDPTSVCSGLKITNQCTDIEPGAIEGCCCSDSGCIDPTANPEKKPNGKGVVCLVGLVSSNNVSSIAETRCFGSCASLTTVVASVNVTAFACVQDSLCNAMNVYDNCGPLPLENNVRGCCCNNADNCNANGFGVQTNKTAPNYHEYPVICYSGLYVNGSPIGGGQWEACNGDCVSVTLNSTYQSKFYSADFYTCDPSSICHQLNVINTCTNYAGGYGACCCDTDTCLDPTHRYPPKRPGKPLKCYVGLKTSNTSVGSEVNCNGQCAFLTGLVGNPPSNVTAYMCAPKRVCKTLELDEKVKQIPLDTALFGMCCDSSDNCNVKDKSIDTSANVSQIVEYPITCYQGIQVNGVWVSNAGFQVCNGECAMLTLNSTVNNGTAITASVYTCDPTAVCNGLGVVNTCVQIQDGLQGCCCRSNGCIDPSKNVTKLPGNPLTCYVGLQTSSNISFGASVVCDGKCSSLSGIVGGQQVTTYHCVDSSICRSLELDDVCNTLYADQEVVACCCDNYDYCNLRDNTTKIPDPPTKNVEFPITCWSGVYLNGNAITPTKWTACSGDCVSVSLNTTLNGTNTATLYTCDPSSVCTGLKTINSCANLQTGLRACCCNTDGCLDPKSARDPGNPLMCYVGVKTGKVSSGASVPCNGKCSSLSGTINGTRIETFHCSDTSICRSLELDNECLPLPGDAEIQGCCCDNKNFCNLDIDPAITPPPVSNFTEPPIACYSGLVINNVSILPAKYVSCQGECASIEIDTIIGQVRHSAALYTCDPSTVCQSLNVSNTCASLDVGVKGCCCNSDVCIDPTKNKSPDAPLTCYVGVYAAYNNFSVGADVVCAGKCASLETIIQNNKVKSYHCVQPAVCSTLALDNSCNTIRTDRDVTGCCCDNGNNCNALNEPVSSNFNGTTPGNTIACWSGLYLNGNPLAKPAYTSCTGDCAVIQFNTTAVGNTTNSLTLYTCDPVTVCNSLNLKNACNTVDSLPGITGCCCDSDACVDGSSIYPKTKNAATMLNAFSAVFLAIVYMMLRC
ncbi:unnamed protein product [Auanema sp. JU1783]|nr:unnamed protein product [Auanema sp. JU1783]